MRYRLRDVGKFRHQNALENLAGKCWQSWPEKISWNIWPENILENCLETSFGNFGRKHILENLASQIWLIEMGPTT